MIRAVDDDFDQSLLRQAFGCFPSGVTAFCGLLDGVAEGMAASSFTSVSLDPALVSVCVANTSTTWPKLAKLDRLGLSVLAGDHAPIARALASKTGDRFGGVDWTATESGAVFVHGATLWLECAPFKRVAAGDHEIVVLQIVALAMYPDVAPMVFHRSNFHELAPTA
ncbi:flavin reductase family protein [Mycobacterium sp. AZCC_0083]|uniref:flavin reductase family protein n=1 Tax=Mycobacterium sp. AZCC_0083 TaxID=2735882 RepID=UPI00160A11CC|nr:flavin reductase family protein [Mycobacterium sp. AZCC_0083]MBB5166849.1 flavin reductase (DIM6/NTAB) family NADH-FMN oxidoreductase RutF [Mycobacterium sp. AZCC_0083]